MAQPKAKTELAPEVTVPAQRKARQVQVSQSDVPSYPLDEALRVAKAIADSYAAKPTRTIDVAAALDTTPGSTRFRMITSASVAYGLTSGSAFADEIAITPLGMRVVRPMTDGDDIKAKREALLKPRILKEFLEKYDRNALPSDGIAKNILEQMGVPVERLDSVLKFVIDSAQSMGLIREMAGKRFVDLGATAIGAESGTAVVRWPNEQSPIAPQQQVGQAAQSQNGAIVSVAPAVYVNIEIHIDAGASSETIEDIFKNMRRYVLNGGGQPDNDTASSD